MLIITIQIISRRKKSFFLFIPILLLSLWLTTINPLVCILPNVFKAFV